MATNAEHQKAWRKRQREKRMQAAMAHMGLALEVASLRKAHGSAPAGQPLRKWAAPPEEIAIEMLREMSVSKVRQVTQQIRTRIKAVEAEARAQRKKPFITLDKPTLLKGPDHGASLLTPRE